MMPELIVKVGMADLNIIVEVGTTLKTTGLGSCVGVTLWDPKTKVAGMAHIMLPSSEIAKEGTLNVAKYADTAIPALIERMIQAGAGKLRLEAKLAGGAQMFAFSGSSDTMRIGPRNVESCKAILSRAGIPVRAEDTGGNFGRTIEFYNQTGVLVLRTVQQGAREI
ncbi:chemotaxis protein CheD [Paenibacillus koleovorans]|uniref:chemotaxis protein CheD n=1 Tax=Paenibacillus koleovorans TaxID=121608 RepID=UPI000FD8AF02|nr:chemotaxis protein CheD [Paenibacillus koleovorans]